MSRVWPVLGVVVLVAGAVLAVLWLARPDATAEQSGEQGVVSAVIDGDTIEVAGVGRVRVIGIDTPERGECGFDAASAALEDLVLGEDVTLVPGAGEDVDRYGRLLRYVEVDGTDAGLRLVESGLAVARYDSRDGYGEHPREQTYVSVDERTRDVCAGRSVGE